MIVTKIAFISIQTVGQTISNSLQTLRKADANALQTLSNSFQTLYKLLSNGLETPLKRFQTLCKLLPNPFKRFPNPFKNVSNFLQTLCKPFANTVQGRLKRRLAQIAMFDKTCFPMEGHKYKASVNGMIKNISWSRNLHNRKQPERMEIFILFAGFITVASPGYKT